MKRANIKRLVKCLNAKRKETVKTARTEEFFMVFGGKKRAKTKVRPKPIMKPGPFPTLDDDTKPRPHVIFTGRFEMNRRRH